MATLTIRNLDDDVRDRLRLRAASNGRSMEAEARAILTDSTAPGKHFGQIWVEAFADAPPGPPIPIAPRDSHGSWGGRDDPADLFTGGR